MTHSRYRVHATASDSLTLRGITHLLTARRGAFELSGQAAEADVVVCASREFTPRTSTQIREVAAICSAPIVLVAEEFDGTAAALIADCRVRSLVTRAEITTDHFVRTVAVTAQGGAVMPGHLLGQVLHQLTEERRSLHRSLGLAPGGLTARETSLLRLAADGYSAREISEELDSAEGTLRTMVTAMLARLGLRNRTHAVTYAITAGVI